MEVGQVLCAVVYSIDAGDTPIPAAEVLIDLKG